MSFFHSFCQNFLVYYGFATSFNTHSKKFEPLLSLVLIIVTCYKFELMVGGETLDASRFLLVNSSFGAFFIIYHRNIYDIYIAYCIPLNFFVFQSISRIVHPHTIIKMFDLVLIIMLIWWLVSLLWCILMIVMVIAMLF
jgi:hypothetical protein